MGIDTDLIVGNYGREDFICGICHDLLEDPIILKKCEHSFCRVCINGVTDSRVSRFWNINNKVKENY